MAGGKNAVLVTQSSMPSFEEFCAEIAPLWETHWLTNRGPKHIELERALEDYLDVEHVSLFVNGHSALECILETMGLGKDGRDEVITTPFTFASTTHAIVRKGLKPVFCDIKPENFTLDPSKLEALVTDKTCAILPVHVYGGLCDVEAIQEIADRHDLKVIYDAAHAFGVRRNGVSAVEFGDASMLSFHATKVFNTIEGGAVCYHDPAYRDALAQWRNFGITGPETVEYVGGNAKMNEFCAAMGICNLRHVDDEIEKRRHVVERYRKRLEGVPGLQLEAAQPGVQSNYAYFPVLFDPERFGVTRDEVFAALAQKGIGARKYFYPLVRDYDCYAGRFDSADTPVAQRVASQVLTLPLYADLPLETVDEICAIVLATAAEEAACA